MNVCDCQRIVCGTSDEFIILNIVICLLLCSVAVTWTNPSRWNINEPKKLDLRKTKFAQNRMEKYSPDTIISIKQQVLVS